MRTKTQKNNAVSITHKPVKKFLICFLVATLLGSCTEIKTTNPGAVGVDRKQYALTSVTSEKMNGLAAQSYTTTLKDADKSNALNPDPQQTERVRAIAQRLIAQTAVFRTDAANWKWEVNVQQNKEINAYCMPGGKIMVYTGLIQQLNLSDDELAAVIGHEISHALREHGRERMSADVLTKGALLLGNIGLRVLGVSGEDADKATAGGGAVAEFGINLPHSREHEREADRIGLELSARAGYDPAAAISLWQKMSKMGGSKPPEFLSTHPADASRIADMRRLLPIVTPLYQATKSKQS
jgi:predicted Zn-dependent protease